METAMKTLEEASFMNGKIVKWAGIVAGHATDDAEFVVRFTDGTSYVIGAWQREGCPLEMSVEEAPIAD